jgi:hypothetical protein
MTVELALEYIIPQRTDELGWKRNYSTDLEHIVLQPLETQVIAAYNELYVLVEDAADVNVSSETGVFDLSIRNANRMEYTHQGEITIKNYSTDIVHLRFIQVIPKNKMK